METIGVIVTKGKTKRPPEVLDEAAHKRLLKRLYNAAGKKSYWEKKESEKVA